MVRPKSEAYTFENFCKENNDSVKRFVEDEKIHIGLRMRMKRLRDKLDELNYRYQNARANIITKQSKIMREGGV